MIPEGKNITGLKGKELFERCTHVLNACKRRLRAVPIFQQPVALRLTIDVFYQASRYSEISYCISFGKTRHANAFPDNEEQNEDVSIEV